MKDIIVSALILGLISGLVRVAAPYSKRFVKWLIDRFVQKAEKGIQQSGMGTVKKAWVLERLNWFGITATDAVCAMIDVSAAAMNSKGEYLQANIKQEISEKITEGVEDTTESLTSKLAGKEKGE